MLSTLLLATSLFCQGQSTTFDIFFGVNLSDQNIQATFHDSDGTYGSFTQSFASLKQSGDCLVSETIHFCFNNEKTEVTFELSIFSVGDPIEDDVTEPILERGSGTCVPQNPKTGT